MHQTVGMFSQSLYKSAFVRSRDDSESSVSKIKKLKQIISQHMNSGVINGIGMLLHSVADVTITAGR